MIMGINGIRSGCDFPLWMQYVLVIYMISFIVLFGNFYAKAYIEKVRLCGSYFILSQLLSFMWAEQLSRYRDWLRVGQSGDRIPVGTRFSSPVQTGPWGPTSLLCNGYRVFPGGKERPGRDADPSPLLVPWSRKSRAIPLLPLWAVRPVQSLSACTRVHFNLPLFTQFHAGNKVPT